MRQLASGNRRAAIAVVLTLSLVVVGCASEQGTEDATETSAASGDSAPTTEAPQESTTTADSGTDTTSEGDSVESQTVVIGQIAHLTGPGADPFGIPIDRAMQMAVEEINGSGYLDSVGVGLELRTDDDGTDATRAVTVLNQYVQDGLQIAISSSFTPVASTLFPIANDEEVLLISVGSGGTGEDLEDYFFRMNDVSGPMTAMGRFLVEDGGAEAPVAIIDGDNAAFPVVASAVEAGIQEAGGPAFATTETISGQDTDFSSILANLLQAQPDAIHIAATPAVVGNVIAQLSALPESEGILKTGAAGGGEQVYEVAGPDSVGTLFAQAWARPEDPGDDIDSAFADRYAERYDAPATAYSALGYDTTRLLAVAIKMLIEDGEEVNGTTLKDILSSAAASDDYQSEALVEGLELPASGAPSYTGVVATIDEEGNVVDATGE